MAGDRKRVPIGLQLYSVHGECSRDLPATLEQVAKIGYVGVELWGYAGGKPEWMGWPVKDLRRMLDGNSLQCCGLLLSVETLLENELSRTIALNQELGNRFLIVSADQKRMSAVDSIMELARILDGAAKELEPVGMFAGYHAHPFDFVQLGDRTAWEILFSNTSERVVMQLDVGNCADGGGDPVAMLEAFPGRARTIHLREYGGAPGAVIGEGKADWEQILHLCETSHPLEWYVVEEGNRDGLGFDVPARSLEALKRMGR